MIVKSRSVEIAILPILNGEEAIDALRDFTHDCMHMHDCKYERLLLIQSPISYNLNPVTGEPILGKMKRARLLSLRELNECKKAK